MGAPNKRAGASITSKHLGQEQRAAVWPEGYRVRVDLCSLCYAHPAGADLPVWGWGPAPVADQQRVCDCCGGLQRSHKAPRLCAHGADSLEGR